MDRPARRLAADRATAPGPSADGAGARTRVRLRVVHAGAFFGLAVLLAGSVTVLFADLLWRTGWWSATGVVLLALFAILALYGATGCMHGVFGFVARRLGGAPLLTRQVRWRRQSIDGTRTALLMPICNEDTVRVFAGLRATYESLRATGEIERFEFFVLSDSTEPARWVAEERAWASLVAELDAGGRMHYRRRLGNQGKKSGNISDFVRAWGGRYRYFVILDADSVMSGSTLVALVKLMEARPTIGLLQTATAIANAESLFGRLQQFANRLYGPMFCAGLDWWAGSSGNYWGHNAIIRTAAFARHCELPPLPGPPPLGGPILSHDFIEAALLLQADWEVCFAHDLPGSWEETPQTMIDHARRDRRWCQGNMQHAIVQFASGIRFASRVHMGLGTLSYLVGPLWLAFVLVANWMLWWKEQTGLSDITVHSIVPGLDVSGATHALLLFVLSMAIVFLPKILAIADLALDHERCRAFGGLWRTGVSTLVETAFSALHAPLNMLWHTRFVAAMLVGRNVGWGSQSRAADGTSWRLAVRRHWGHTAVGLAWGAVNWLLLPATFWWFAPLLLGMVLAIPLSVLTSRTGLGRRARALGLLVTPEETVPPPELASLRRRMTIHERSTRAAAPVATPPLAELVVDPGLNAVHVMLAGESRRSQDTARALDRLAAAGLDARVIAQRLLALGPGACSPEEQRFLLHDPAAMAWLHDQIRCQAADRLAPGWRDVIEELDATRPATPARS